MVSFEAVLQTISWTDIKLTCSCVKGRLCLVTGVYCACVHDGSRYRTVLLWAPKSEYGTVVDLAEHGGYGCGFYTGMRRHLADKMRFSGL